MNKYLPDIDELIHSSMESYQETPSPSVKERLEASLDRKDAESSRKRLIGWQRASALLLFLLAGFVIYETGMWEIRQDNMRKDHAAGENRGPATIEQKPNTPGIPSEKGQQDENIRRPAKKNWAVDLPTIQANTNMNPINSQKKKARPDQYAYPLLAKRQPGPLLNRQPFDPQIDHHSLLKYHVISGTPGKHRIGFKPYWMISAVFSYEAAGYNLDSDWPTEISNIKHREVHEPSYSGGVLIARQLTPRWAIQTGLLYSSTTIGIGSHKIYAFLDPNGDVAYKYITSSGYAYVKPKSFAPPTFGDSVIATEGKHSLRYITVPVSVKYHAGKNKFSFTPGVGIEANFLTDTRVETELQTPANNELVFVNKLYGARSFYWSLTADAEIRYALNKKTSLSFCPSFHRSISPITENTLVETFPYSFRWGIGLNIKL